MHLYTQDERDAHTYTYTPQTLSTITSLLPSESTAVICPNLQPPENGRVFDPVIAGFESLAPYFCNPGFMRVGVFVRTCQSDGTWSGEEPVCIRKLFFCVPARIDVIRNKLPIRTIPVCRGNVIMLESQLIMWS